MSSKADRQFEKLVLELFQKHHKDLQLTVRSSSRSHFDVEVRIDGLGNVGFRLVATSKSTRRSQVETDPRVFGDTEEVTKRAMESWYPGKTSTWTEHRRNITLQAWNLPGSEIKDYTANYEYDPGYATGQWSDDYEIEKIFNLLTDLQVSQVRAQEIAKETDYANSLADAFKKLN